MNQKPRTKSNEKHGSTVIIVDDDDDMRGALANLFNSVELDVVLFGSAQNFSLRDFPRRRAALCLIFVCQASAA